MSKTVMLIRRKSDGKLLTDIINDACQVHNIYDGETLLLAEKEYFIGYSEDKGFDAESDYEEVDDIKDTLIEGQLHCYECKHDKDCDEKFDNCDANCLDDNQVYHFKSCEI